MDKSKEVEINEVLSNRPTGTLPDEGGSLFSKEGKNTQLCRPSPWPELPIPLFSLTSEEWPLVPSISVGSKALDVGGKAEPGFAITTI